MEKIKFRAWMLDSKRLIQPCYTEIFKDGSFLAGDNNVTSTECILMQFTGLLDETGEEIYEGDICESIYTGSSGLLHRNQVIWSKEGASFIFADEALWVWEELKIIGNVYENPELLN